MSEFFERFQSWTVSKGTAYGRTEQDSSMYDTVLDLTDGTVKMGVQREWGEWVLFLMSPCCEARSEKRRGRLSCLDCGSPLPPPLDKHDRTFEILDRVRKRDVVETVASWLPANVLDATLQAHDVVEWLYPFTFRYEREFEWED